MSCRTLPCPSISWGSKTPEFHAWLMARPELQLRYVSTGREAEIWRLGNAFVLKNWTRWNHVSAQNLYLLLQTLRSAGLPVPPVAGWGHDADGHDVLVTRNSGEGISWSAGQRLCELAAILVQIHCTPLTALPNCLPSDGSGSPAHFPECWLPNLDGQGDVAAILQHLRRDLSPGERRLIHGDYHLGNVVACREQLTIIDWSEARLGDARYDLAWAGVLLLIYTDPEAYTIFRDAYVKVAHGRVHLEELRLVEVFAGLRWLVLARTAPVPIEKEKIVRIIRFIRERLPEQLRDALQGDIVTHNLTRGRGRGARMEHGRPIA